jgi:hypothetical protein
MIAYLYVHIGYHSNQIYTDKHSVPYKIHHFYNSQLDIKLEEKSSWHKRFSFIYWVIVYCRLEYIFVNW